MCIILIRLAKQQLRLVVKTVFFCPCEQKISCEKFIIVVVVVCLYTYMVLHALSTIVLPEYWFQSVDTPTVLGSPFSA